jgi:hypothetical protein
MRFKQSPAGYKRVDQADDDADVDGDDNGSLLVDNELGVSSDRANNNNNNDVDVAPPPPPPKSLPSLLVHVRTVTGQIIDVTLRAFDTHATWVVRVLL